MDEEVTAVVAEIQRLCKERKSSAEKFFARIIRRALDEVIDASRTQRFTIGDLEKTEKTYIGTKVEIIVRSELDLRRGTVTDVLVTGVPVDIKWSLSMQWMIGPENVDRICLGLGLDSSGTRFSVGVFRASRANLRSGSNRDQKLSLSAIGFETVEWVVRDAMLPTDFVAELVPDVRAEIFSAASAQERVFRLFSLCPMTQIPRSAIEIVAGGKKDPMRRLRQDAYNTTGLHGLRIVSTKYGKEQLHSLGFTKLLPNHFVGIPNEK